jgi:hypothetical protein
VAKLPVFSPKVTIMLKRVVSGGQTGVDRAGLDAALEVGLPIGGYCPKGRLAEDGCVPEHYPLVELSSERYATRTEKNVVESDGTLVLNMGRLTEGTKATVDYAVQHGKPFLVLQLDRAPGQEEVLAWLEANRIATLNVAGPRESKHPGIYQLALEFLREVLRGLAGVA